MPAGPDLMQTVHGTAIAIGGRAALLRGPSGAGKSDLALRCLAIGACGLVLEPALLVCDDRAMIVRADDDIFVSAPPSISGRLEVRGLGIFAVPTLDRARLVLVVDLVGSDVPIERMPEPATVDIEGIAVGIMAVHAFETSAAAKVLLALQAHAGRGHTA